MRLHHGVMVFALAALPGCGAGMSGQPAASSPVAIGSDGSEAVCRLAGPTHELALEARETSGLVESRHAPGVLWTHNDSGNDETLFAIDTTGRLLARVTVVGATQVDWEDLEAGPCESGTCLHIADIGDNFRRRDSVTVYTVPEPLLDVPAAVPMVARAAAFSLRYPDGPQDAEAIFILPSGDLYVVTKGRHAAIALYRLPRAARRPGATATLERIRELWPLPGDERDRVTAATASPDGRRVAIRTYRRLYLFQAASLVAPGAPATPVVVDLTPLAEKQGEAVALADDGVVRLTSEAEAVADRPQLSSLRCNRGAGK